jgi:hypothetical protein
MGEIKVNYLRIIKLKELNSVAFSPQANYTDRATAACRRSWCQLLRIEGVAWSVQRIPRPLIRLSWPEPLLFHSSSSSIILTRLSGPVCLTRLDWSKYSYQNDCDGEVIYLHPVWNQIYGRIQLPRLSLQPLKIRKVYVPEQLRGRH